MTARPFATLTPDRPPPGKAKRAAAGRWRTFNLFIDATLRTLPRAELAVWLTLYRDARPDGLARTGQADLARRAGCNVGTVKRAVAGLARRGLLAVVRRGGIGRGPSVYRLRAAAEYGRAGATL